MLGLLKVIDGLLCLELERLEGKPEGLTVAGGSILCFPLPHLPRPPQGASLPGKPTTFYSFADSSTAFINANAVQIRCKGQQQWMALTGEEDPTSARAWALFPEMGICQENGGLGRRSD